MQWDCVKHDETFLETLWGIYNKFDQRIKEMDGYDEEMLKQIEHQFDNNDFSWYLTVNKSRSIYD